jgi:hypothetical protein
MALEDCKCNFGRSRIGYRLTALCFNTQAICVSLTRITALELTDSALLTTYGPSTKMSLRPSHTVLLITRVLQ